MIIETQQTSDINVMNFFPPRPVLKSGTAEFVDAKSLRRSPLAEKIFDLGEIVSVFITPDMLSVTKEENASWEDLKPQILAEIMDHLSLGEATVITPQASDSDQEVVKQIEGLITARIRPAIRQDGGDIVFRKFENGIVYVELLGNCSGCPYAAITLKDGVEKLLKTYIPQVKAVKNFEKDNTAQ